MHNITIGRRVEFDSEHGTQRGTVLNVCPGTSRTAPYALVEVDHVLNGIHWSVELDKITLLPIAAGGVHP